MTMTTPYVDIRHGKAVVNFHTNLLVALALFTLGAAAILVWDQHAPSFHIILDTSVALVCGLIALLLTDIAVRANRTLSLLLAIAFAVGAIGEVIHTAAALGWLSGGEYGARNQQWPAGTWLPANYVLAIGVVAATLLRDRPVGRSWLLALGLVALYLLLYAAFLRVPRYWPPGLLGVTRPTLAAIPLLWLWVAVLFQRMTRDNPSAFSMTAMALLMAVAQGVMLYSVLPNDSIAMVAHWGKLAAGLLFLVSLFQIGAADTARRLRTEAELTERNQGLEERMRERTLALERSNFELRAQISLTLEAEVRLTAQLERMELLGRIIRAVGARMDLRSVYQIVIQSLEDQLPADFSCLLLPGGDDVMTVHHVGTASMMLARRMNISEGDAVAMAEEKAARARAGEQIHLGELAREQSPLARTLASAGLGAAVLSPLLAEDRMLGILLTARFLPDSFTALDRDFLGQLSAHIALAAHHARLIAHLKTAYDELSQTQATALQQERLRALGQMASGIAHDINNAVSPLSLRTTALLETEKNLPPHLRDYLGMVRRVTNGVAATMARLREFYRQREPSAETQPVELNALAGQTLELTRARWSDMPQQRGIVVTVRHDAEVPRVLADGHENELREALTNLIFNAVDALPQGGEIVVRVGLAGEPPHGFIEVRDNGAGMDEDTRRRCLEPFFTTKGERGTGLGLAMVLGTAKRHGAAIAIDSARGRGTAIRLDFPPSQSQAAAAPEPVAERALPRALKLLLIDDDPFVLESTEIVMQLDGHDVTCARNGKMGLAAFSEALEKGAPFEAVITDLGMPGMDGNDVTREIKSLSPATPVILMTGWGQSGRGNGKSESLADAVLPKPPELDDIRATLLRLT